MELRNESLCLRNVIYFDYRSEGLKRIKEIFVVNGRFTFKRQNASLKTIDCADYVMTPSFAQIHTHLCQHLYKGLAEDLPLFDWLKKRVLPYEKNLTKDVLRLSCRMALHELIDSGTTVILDMGTFANQEVILEEIEKSGVTGYSGNILLDRRVGKWCNDLDSYIDYSEDMIKFAKSQKRANYALNPRFFPGLTKRGIKKMLLLRDKYDLIIHTHASETKQENTFAFKEYKKSNIQAMNEAGMLSKKTVIAHCIHLDETDFKLLQSFESTVCHCPSSNMKLGSGIAEIDKMNKMKINVGLGSDGAPCNNNMSQLMEMRLCGLLQKVRRGPKSMKAEMIFKMATFNGLKALSLEREMGSIEEGKRADFLLIKKESVHSAPFEANPFSSLVYSAYPSDIEYVFAEGRALKEKGRVKVYDLEELLDEKKKLLKNLLLDRL
ncbi:MAG: amidohydrolase family protein [bacterium]|nr:amidohydrolase family protein [bacterium]